ncbi:MAG: ABC transporter ATP-binding protein [Bacteroidales bacterium]|nr:ABC transporter ATP-binding protein [Bacteroidales bacterium]
MHTRFIRRLSMANRAVEKSLRYALVKRMQELSLSFHDFFDSGRLHSKIIRDVESVELLSRQLMNTVFTASLNITFSFIATLLHNYFVALLYLLTIPLSGLLIYRYRKKMVKSVEEYRAQIENMSARVSEMVQMIPITRAHGLEETEIRQMDEQFERVRSGGIKLDVINAYFGASAWVSFQVFQFISLIVTAFMALKGYIKVGDVVMFQGFFSLIINSVNVMVMIMPELNRGFDSIRSLGEILECPDIEQNQGKAPVDAVNGEIRFSNVSFSYKKGREVIQSFNLDIHPGECIAFVGASGAGKSTLMNLVIGYRRPEKGQIFLDGKDMAELDLRTYRRYISVVPQNIILFSGTIRENILYGIEQDSVDMDFFTKILKIARVDEFINQLPKGLETTIGEYGNRLSGGQKQRIAIARSLIRDPKIILFDEATSALDTESERHIQDALKDMIKGRTTFMVAHRLSTIRMADKIIVLENGKVIETGNFSELVKKGGQFYDYYKLQYES